MKRFHFYMSEGLRRALKKRSTKTGVPVAEIIRRAVAEYLRREQRDEKPKR